MSKAEREAFWRRLDALHRSLVYDQSPLWRGAASFVVEMGAQSEDAAKFNRASALYFHLFGYEVLNSVVLLRENELHILARGEKGAELERALGARGGDRKISLKVHAWESAASVQPLVAAAAAAGATLGVLRGDADARREGALLRAWDAAVRKEGLILVDVSRAVGGALAVKDDDAIVRTAAAARVACRALCDGVTRLVEAAFDAERSDSGTGAGRERATHDALAQQIDALMCDALAPHCARTVPQLKDVSAAAAKRCAAVASAACSGGRARSTRLVESCYFPIVTSGGACTTDAGAASDGDAVKDDVVVVEFGARFASYCTNVARTFFVEPLASLERCYAALRGAHAACVAAMREGAPLCAVAAAAHDWLEQNDAAHLAKFLPRHNFGFALGLDFRDDDLVLTRSNTQRHFEARMVFNVAVGLHGVPLEASERRKARGAIRDLKKVSMLLADTVLVQSGGAPPVVLTDFSPTQPALKDWCDVSNLASRQRERAAALAAQRAAAAEAELLAQLDAEEVGSKKKKMLAAAANAAKTAATAAAAPPPAAAAEDDAPSKKKKKNGRAEAPVAPPAAPPAKKEAAKEPEVEHEASKRSKDRKPSAAPRAKEVVYDADDTDATDDEDDGTARASDDDEDDDASDDSDDDSDDAAAAPRGKAAAVPRAEEAGGASPLDDEASMLLERVRAAARSRWCEACDAAAGDADAFLSKHYGAKRSRLPRASAALLDAADELRGAMGVWRTIERALENAKTPDALQVALKRATAAGFSAKATAVKRARRRCKELEQAAAAPPAPQPTTYAQPAFASSFANNAPMPLQPRAAPVQAPPEAARPAGLSMQQQADLRQRNVDAAAGFLGGSAGFGPLGALGHDFAAAGGNRPHPDVAGGNNRPHPGGNRSKSMDELTRFFHGDEREIAQLRAQGVDLTTLVVNARRDAPRPYVRYRDRDADVPPPETAVAVGRVLGMLSRAAPRVFVDLNAAERAGLLVRGGCPPREWLALVHEPPGAPPPRPESPQLGLGGSGGGAPSIFSAAAADSGFAVHHARQHPVSALGGDAQYNNYYGPQDAYYDGVPASLSLGHANVRPMPNSLPEPSFAPKRGVVIDDDAPPPALPYQRQRAPPPAAPPRHDAPPEFSVARAAPPQRHRERFDGGGFGESFGGQGRFEAGGFESRFDGARFDDGGGFHGMPRVGQMQPDAVVFQPWHAEPQIVVPQPPQSQPQPPPFNFDDFSAMAEAAYSAAVTAAGSH
ncbi:hypothetical protein M885DRAFT_514296 [Pelagophyceae sp. CCMP2097]|nr:hypothetical protein M885DRAFT_514296 [Pelagophyceae sp. CCMP2097]